MSIASAKSIGHLFSQKQLTSERKYEKLFLEVPKSSIVFYDYRVNSTWDDLLQQEFSAPYFLLMTQFLYEERTSHEVFPPHEKVLAALDATSLDTTKVVILGQDPYHGLGQADGLAFSVSHNVAVPPSLRNILKELHHDLGIPIPSHGNLKAWAEQGVLLLNTTLTVREGEPGSHYGRGWETLTDAIINVINQKADPVVFLLWGAHARKKKNLITQPHHVVIEGAHPSPLSAYRGFFGSKPFSRVNTALEESGQRPINWEIPP
jgi:uracil-DNA glycosylase